MPRKRKAARQYLAAAETLPRWQREVLLAGFPMLSCFENWRAWRESPEAEGAWRAHGAELLKRCCGWRPYAWWRYERGRDKPGSGLGRERREWAEFQELKALRALQPGEGGRFLAAHPSGPPAESTDRTPSVVVWPDPKPKPITAPKVPDTIQ
jgi:hypothetical protein